MRRRPAHAAAFAVLLLVIGQLSALEHRASTRHVICPQHGEEIEAVKLAGDVDHSETSRWVGVESSGGGEHEDCVIARTLQQSSATPHTPPSPAITILLSTSVLVTPAPLVLTFERYRIAPKTSPPA